MDVETQKELQSKYLQVFKNAEFVHGYIKKSKKPNKLHDKSINANKIYYASGVSKFFIDNPNDCLALKVPAGYNLTDLDYPEKDFIEKNKNYEIIKHKYESLIHYLIDSGCKVIITKTSKGYHIYSKNNNDMNQRNISTSTSGNVTYSLLDQVDYKFSYENKEVFAYAPIYTENSKNNAIKERSVIYVGVDTLENLEPLHILLQSPKQKVTLSNKVMEWNKYVNNQLSNINKNMKDGSGRENKLHEYAMRLCDFELNLEEIQFLLFFASQLLMGEPMDSSKVENIFKQAKEHLNSLKGKVDNNGDTTTLLYSAAYDQGFGSKPSTKLEKIVIKYLDVFYKDVIILNQEILIKDGKSYVKYNEQELKKLITTRIEEATYVGMAVDKFVNMIDRAIKRRLVLTMHEYSQKKTPDHVIAFPNGYFDLEQEMFSSEERLNEINLKSIQTDYNPEPQQGYTKAVKHYLMGLANNNANTYLNIRDLLGTILMKKTRDHKSFFILYGSKDGDNGKSTFLELLHDIVGRSQTSSTSLEKLLSQFGLSALENDLMTTCGELGEEVTTGYDTLKSITGGDEIPLEKKGIDIYNGRLMTTLIFASNHRTKFVNAQGDEALNKRAKFIDFHNSFSKDIDQDFDVGILKDEGFKQAFLKEMIDCTLDLKSRNYQLHNYVPQDPTDYIKKITKSTDKRDSIEIFIERCGGIKALIGVKNKIIWDAYVNFANTTPNAKHVGSKEFYTYLFNNYQMHFISIDRSIAGIRHRGQFAFIGSEPPVDLVITVGEFESRCQRFAKENSKKSIYNEEDLS